MRLPIKLIFITSLILSFLFFTKIVRGQDINQKNWTLLEKVSEGKKLLKVSRDLRFVERKGKLIRREIALAVLNITTGEIFEKRYWLDESDINKAIYLRANYVTNPGNMPKFMSVDINDEFSVSVNWWNSHNSDLTFAPVDNPEDDTYVVIGNKYLHSNSAIPFPEDKTGKKYSDIIYGPYSEGVHDRGVISNGIQYLNTKVDQAFDELQNAGVMSRAFPGQLVVDTIRKNLIKHILITEQTDPKWMLNATEEERLKLAERVLVRYGLNENATFRYTYSRTNALGPAQIMPFTYSYPERIVKKRKKVGRVGGTGMVQVYPSAYLIKDINIGRVDMVNAIKAAVLVCDDHMVLIVERVRRSGPQAKRIFESKDDDELDIVRAMIYNGGPGKYSLITGGINPRSRGARETTDFVKKFKIIRSLELFV